MPRLRAAVLALAVLSGLATLLPCRAAFADPTKDQCVEADTAAQTERRALHFRAARSQLEVCARPACPKLVREDCTQRLSDLDATTPSIVFAAKDAAGEDVVAVRVAMDGAPFATELAGVALPVDPGVHTFTFDADGVATVTKKVVIREGEKGRAERIVLAAAAALATSRAVVVPVATPVIPDPSVSTLSSSSSSWTSQKTAAVALGAVGVVGVIVGSVMGGLSFSTWSSSQSECGTSSCTDRTKALSDHDTATTFATVSDIGFIAGGALVATGVVVFLTSPSSSWKSSGMWRVVPRARAGGGGMSLEGRF